MAESVEDITKNIESETENENNENENQNDNEEIPLRKEKKRADRIKHYKRYKKLINYKHIHNIKKDLGTGSLSSHPNPNPLVEMSLIQKEKARLKI